MSTYEKIFELGDKLAHQNPRYLTETNPKDIEKKLQELLIKAEKLVK